ncbi:MAG: hypothetical protein BSR46_15175 [Candidatus Dactylopiibacterium carminicum]|nr:N-acetyltransferase [Candidatus Dactylopiibacterium carminicum]PAS96631.1 MAG: hypothetical protein BSR46_15175 [Candidatus Dactylopiibacterium carminicum]
MSVNIRDEHAGDEEAIARLTRQAFLGQKHTCGKEYLLVGALRDAGALSLSLVAERGGQLVGHIAFSPVRIEGCEQGWFGIGPLSVLAGHQRQGIGSLLLREGMAQIRQRAALGCVVVGDLNYYQRFGFKAYPALRYGDMPLFAQSFTGEIPQGTLHYHPAFDICNT